MPILNRPSRRLAWWVSRLPTNRLRILAHRVIFGYSISDKASLGRGTLLATTTVEIGRSKLGTRNEIYGPCRFVMGDGATLGDRNTIECGAWVLEARFKDRNYQRECLLGDSTLMTSDHYIDATGGFKLETGAWLAGRASQFWTHGLGPAEVRIGERTYVGSAVRFAPGAAVGADCVIGMGSVVTGVFSETRCLIAGVPAKVLKPLEPSERSFDRR